MTGPTGATGAAGPTGATGAAGLDGGLSSNYIYAYSTTSGSVANYSNIPFGNTSYSNGISSDGSKFTVSEAGIYEVSYNLSTLTTPGATIALCFDGAPQAATFVNVTDGTSSTQLLFLDPQLPLSLQPISDSDLKLFTYTDAVGTTISAQIVIKQVG